MMMMWMMTRSPALFVLLSLSATTTSVTGLSVRRNSYTPWGPYHVDDWKEMITEDLDDTAMDSKEKSELLELAAKEYDGLANRASEAKVAITEDYKVSPTSLPPFLRPGKPFYGVSSPLPPASTPLKDAPNEASPALASSSRLRGAITPVDGVSETMFAHDGVSPPLPPLTGSQRHSAAASNGTIGHHWPSGAVALFKDAPDEAPPASAPPPGLLGANPPVETVRENMLAQEGVLASHGLEGGPIEINAHDWAHLVAEELDRLKANQRAHEVEQRSERVPFWPNEAQPQQKDSSDSGRNSHKIFGPDAWPMYIFNTTKHGARIMDEMQDRGGESAGTRGFPETSWRQLSTPAL